MKSLYLLFFLMLQLPGFGQADVHAKQYAGMLLKVTYKKNSLLPPPVFALQSSPGFRFSNHTPVLYEHFYQNDSIGFSYHSNSHVKDPYRKNKEHLIGKKIIHHGSSYLFYDQLQYEHVNNPNIDMKCLVKDSLKKLNWTFYDQTKIIHDQTCYLAIHVTEKSDTVLAWFTTKMPFKNNVRGYQGLPGLAMEIYDQRINMHYLVKEIKEIDGALMLPENCRILNTAAFRKEYDLKRSMYIDK